jgi:hypothetical protein
MEVHHHAHTPRNKWTHYFWEFLMLFLAVFCGFLAENQREHYVERKRERQYMQSMFEDLKSDTAELAIWENRINGNLSHMDTSLSVLFLDELEYKDIVHCYNSIPHTARNVAVNLEERTYDQLKSSGNLRLIHNRSLTDSLAAYWHNVHYHEDVLQANYENESREIRELIVSMLNYDNFPNRMHIDSSVIETKDLRLLKDDFALRVKLGNRIASQRRQLKTAFRNSLLRIRRQANGLISRINEEYNLK